MDVLTGKVIPLNLGFVGVINRSQEGIAIFGTQDLITLTRNKTSCRKSRSEKR